ncbi:hypothetical protein JCM10003_1123 [Bacteroides pyogenes JCM 10003]|nr:hypothetical protein JCM10003_1123 [Bacteroides pyogenes JCM 10003]
MFYRFVYYREMLVETGCQGNWLYFTDLSIAVFSGFFIIEALQIKMILKVFPYYCRFAYALFTSIAFVFYS